MWACGVLRQGMRAADGGHNVEATGVSSHAGQGGETAAAPDVSVARHS